VADPMSELLADFLAEREVLDRLLSSISREAWDVSSPAEGWRLRDCVTHLGEMDERAAAVTVPGSLAPQRGVGEPGSELTPTQAWARGLSTDEVLAFWREAGAALVEAMRPLKGEERLPWAGPPMSARSFLTARLMEYWSHGLDIHDAAGVAPVDSDRLRQIAHLGYITRGFAYRNRGLEPPATPLYVELTAPGGDTWWWGPRDAPDRIIGSAGDFCRVVTQRIHYQDTSLKASGERAQEFLLVAQAFAGPPGPGRPPKGPRV
jgi:uncharacterized protein (TIGR03084 family)